MIRLAKRVLVAPAVWFVLLTAWARERSAKAAFNRLAIGRTEYERSLQVAADLRRQADRLRELARA